LAVWERMGKEIFSKKMPEFVVSHSGSGWNVHDGKNIHGFARFLGCPNSTKLNENEEQFIWKN
jgi:hypothetical protein